jgi:hypothetical protein
MKPKGSNTVFMVIALLVALGTAYLRCLEHGLGSRRWACRLPNLPILMARPKAQPVSR